MTLSSRNFMARSRPESAGLSPSMISQSCSLTGTNRSRNVIRESDCDESRPKSAALQMVGFFLVADGGSRVACGVVTEQN